MVAFQAARIRQVMRLILICAFVIALLGTALLSFWRKDSVSFNPALSPFNEIVACHDDYDCVAIAWNPNGSCTGQAVAINSSSRQTVENNRALYGLPKKQDKQLMPPCGRPFILPERAFCEKGECRIECGTGGETWFDNWWYTKSSACTVDYWPPRQLMQ